MKLSIKKYVWLFVPIIMLFFIYPPTGAAAEKANGGKCTYSTWEWNTKTKRAENHRTVVKPYAELTAAEKDPHSNCTVCEEDQRTVSIEGVPQFNVCKDYAEDVKKAVTKIAADGFPIKTIISYRVGKSKGDIDAKGMRTQFSNHSFGTALDINAEINGLYTNCYEFGKKCQLLRGGPWQQGMPGTITKDSIAYKAFAEIGWHWAGELQGRQKDFMHFSLSGD
jgi:hypothetical protein